MVNVVPLAIVPVIVGLLIVMLVKASVFGSVVYETIVVPLCKYELPVTVAPVMLTAG